jgi:hypothetical protein
MTELIVVNRTGTVHRRDKLTDCATLRMTRDNWRYTTPLACRVYSLPPCAACWSVPLEYSRMVHGRSAV